MRGFDRLTKETRKEIKMRRKAMRRAARKVMIYDYGFTDQEAVSFLRSHKVSWLVAAR